VTSTLARNGFGPGNDGLRVIGHLARRSECTALRWEGR
jgi:hypothetical protein